MTAITDLLFPVVLALIGLGALIWFLWDYKRGGGY